MKKSLALAGAAALALVLSGCGTGTPVAEPTVTVTETDIVTESPTPEPTVTETETVTPEPAPDPVTDAHLSIPDCPRLNPELAEWAAGGTMTPLDGDDAGQLAPILGPAAQEALANARQVMGCTYDNGSESHSEWVVELSHGDMTDFREALKVSGYDESIIDDALRYSNGTDNYLVCGNAWIILSDDNADWERSAIDTLVDANPDIVT